ncbi:MAG TPA: hypothetical protein VF524_04860 [Polyangia bacterium]
MKKLSPLSVPFAVAFALLSGASTAQDRPNTTLVQKSKASLLSSSKAKAPTQSPAQLSGASERSGAKRNSPSPRTAPTTEEMHHGCHGMDADA